MEDKQATNEGRKLRKKGKRILRRVLAYGVSQDRADELKDLCDLCRWTWCRQDPLNDCATAANACKRWCPGLCAAHAILREQLIREDWEEYEREYGCGSDWE